MLPLKRPRGAWAARRPHERPSYDWHPPTCLACEKGIHFWNGFSHAYLPNKRRTVSLRTHTRSNQCSPNCGSCYDKAKGRDFR